MRKFVLLVAICIVVPIFIPHDASAQTVWKVKNASGKVVGTVRKAVGEMNDHAWYKVRSTGGIPRGEIWADAVSPLGQWYAGMYLPGDGGIRESATIFIGTRYVPWYTLDSETEGSPIGRVIERKKRWVVQWDLSDDFSDWHTRGYVAGSCKRWAALGAVWILDDKWP